MHKILIVYLLIICSLNAKATTAQETQKKDTLENVTKPVQEYNNPRGVLNYDKSTIKKITTEEKTIRDFQNNKDFNYIELAQEDTWWSRFKQKINDFYNAFIRWLTGGDEATGIWRFVIEILPYLLLLGFLIFLVWLFMKMDSGTLMMEKIKAPESLLSDDEELIQRQDLQQLIEQALSEGNYRLAVRFYYLLILQKMSAKDIIDWQVQKTNHEYVYEIDDLELREKFSKVTGIYDYIWYGNFEVDKIAFAKAESSFNSIKNQL